MMARSKARLLCWLGLVLAGLIIVFGVSKIVNPAGAPAPLPDETFSFDAAPAAGSSTVDGAGASCGVGVDDFGSDAVFIPDICAGASLVSARFVGGQLELPTDMSKASIYHGSAAPSASSGVVLIAAHVSWNNAAGPFHELHRLKPGAVILVKRSGVVSRFVASKMEVFDGHKARSEWLEDSGSPRVVLVTCGGRWVGGHYQNLVAVTGQRL